MKINTVSINDDTLYCMITINAYEFRTHYIKQIDDNVPLVGGSYVFLINGETQIEESIDHVECELVHHYGGRYDDDGNLI